METNAVRHTSTAYTRLWNRPILLMTSCIRHYWITLNDKICEYGCFHQGKTSNRRFFWGFFSLKGFNFLITNMLLFYQKLKLTQVMFLSISNRYCCIFVTAFVIRHWSLWSTWQVNLSRCLRFGDLHVVLWWIRGLIAVAIYILCCQVLHMCPGKYAALIKVLAIRLGVQWVQIMCEQQQHKMLQQGCPLIKSNVKSSWRNFMDLSVNGEICLTISGVTVNHIGYC